LHAFINKSVPEVMRRITCKLFAVLNRFLESGGNSQVGIHAKRKLESTAYIGSETLKIRISSLTHEIELYTDTTRLPDLSSSLYHILVGDKALKGDYYQAAVVASTMVSGFSGLFYSVEGARY
jgi:hypothetical protein